MPPCMPCWGAPGSSCWACPSYPREPSARPACHSFKFTCYAVRRVLTGLAMMTTPVTTACLLVPPPPHKHTVCLPHTICLPQALQCVYAKP